MTGSIDFEYDREHDVVIARPRWNVETAAEVMRWYELQVDYLKGRFGSPKDLITLNDAFDVAPRIATLWGAYRARLHETSVRFSVRVASNPRVLLTTNTSGVRYAVSSVEAADLSEALRTLCRLRVAADRTATVTKQPLSRRTLPQFELHAEGSQVVVSGALEVPTVTSHLAATTPLEMAMEGVRCAAANAPPGQLARSLVRGPVVVVDARGSPLGLATVDRDRSLDTRAEARTWVVPMPTLEESDPLATALNLMATSRARRFCVVDREGLATGMLSDVIAMTWLARRRRLALGIEAACPKTIPGMPGWRG